MQVLMGQSTINAGFPIAMYVWLIEGTITLSFYLHHSVISYEILDLPPGYVRPLLTSLVSAVGCWLSSESWCDFFRWILSEWWLWSHWSQRFWWHASNGYQRFKRFEENLVDGDWNHGIWLDFAFSWECHHPNCYSLHHFSEGWRATINQIYIDI